MISNFDIELYDKIIDRGLCQGVGERDGQMCIEAAICTALNLPHGDDPQCVSAAVRSYKIQLNDAKWSTPQARAKGLRDLGIAQLGSKGVVGDAEFSKRIAEQTIRVIIPALFREVFPNNEGCLKAAAQCESEGTADAADAAAYAAYAAYAARAARAADAAARAADAAADAADAAADAAAYAADAARAARAAADKYLLLSASLALQILKDMQSPGCQLLGAS